MKTVLMLLACMVAAASCENREVASKDLATSSSVYYNYGGYGGPYGYVRPYAAYSFFGGPYYGRLGYNNYAQLGQAVGTYYGGYGLGTGLGSGLGALNSLGGYGYGGLGYGGLGYSGIY